ncbi:MAG: hypothetical protein ACK4E5_12200 [Erythrobacter cryptus]
MNAPTPLPADHRRDALRARIEAAERRNAARSLGDQARAAASAAADYTRAHPLTVIGGALALGLALGLLTRPGRTLAASALAGTGKAVRGAGSGAARGVRRAASLTGSRLGRLLGEAAMAWVLALIDEAMAAGREGQERAQSLGAAAGAKAQALGAEAAARAEVTKRRGAALARHARSAARRAVRELAARRQD